MSSSLLEILALMEQAIAEREGSEKWRSVISGDTFEPSDEEEKQASAFFENPNPIFVFGRGFLLFEGLLHKSQNF